MVRLCCAFGALRRALALVAEARAAGTKPRLRTLAAVLARAAETGDRGTCDEVWSQLPELGLEPQDMEFASMLRGLRGAPERQRQVLHQMLEELPLPSDPSLLEEIGRAFGVEGAAGLRGASSPMAVGSQEQGRRWRVGWTAVDANGTCALSSRRLQALDVSTDEEAELFASTMRLANDNGCNRNFCKFQRWLEEQQPYDVVIDGANVGFNNQNHEGGQFQYPQIHAVVTKLRDEGKRVLLVLHPKWLKEDADLSVVKRKRRKLDQISSQSTPPQCQDEAEAGPELEYPHEPVHEAECRAAPGTPLYLIRQWKEWGVLVRVPFQDCDDWYWLYAALESARKGARHVQVVSNDHMRDHHWRMLSNRAFLKWRGRHMTGVSIQTDPETPDVHRVILMPPRPFSLHAQVSTDGEAWHFPVPAIPSRAAQLASGRPVPRKEIESAEYNWLVAWLAQ
mmetsp:Transcript_8934/g.27746  ORF Transcript_8934/g.27746 Transcript_8934/m.27746 type:complete len:452 (-) Transcript_8934:90-1445(-)